MVVGGWVVVNTDKQGSSISVVVVVVACGAHHAAPNMDSHGVVVDIGAY